MNESLFRAAGAPLLPRERLQFIVNRNRSGNNLEVRVPENRGGTGAKGLPLPGLSEATGGFGVRVLLWSSEPHLMDAGWCLCSERIDFSGPLARCARPELHSGSPDVSAYDLLAVLSGLALVLVTGADEADFRLAALAARPSAEMRCTRSCAF
ncbi:hypothetical protein Pan110_03810 [Gimesia panareensis]|nr:hypothetical protein Pan110_03810 [Gimesia panareensis]